MTEDTKQIKETFLRVQTNDIPNLSGTNDRWNALPERLRIAYTQGIYRGLQAELPGEQ